MTGPGLLEESLPMRVMHSLIVYIVDIIMGIIIGTGITIIIVIVIIIS